MSKNELKRILKMYKTGQLTSYYVFNAFNNYYQSKLPNDERINEMAVNEILYNDSKRSWWTQGAKYIRDFIKK